MPKDTTFIYSKNIKNPTQEFENITLVPNQDATGAGLWLIKKDRELCDDSITEEVVSVTIDFDTCYSIENIINLIP